MHTFFSKEEATAFFNTKKLHLQIKNNYLLYKRY
jgi:hypothetical protein